MSNENKSQQKALEKQKKPKKKPVGPDYRNNQREIVVTRLAPPPHTTDGRKLGPTLASMVPEHQRNCIPGQALKTVMNQKSEKKRDVNYKSDAKRAVRKLAPFGGLPGVDIPYALQTDSDVQMGKLGNFRIYGLNQARFNALIAALRHGATKGIACQLAGISPVTLSNWLRWGGEGKEPYVFLRACFLEAEAELQTRLIKRVLEAGLDNDVYEEVTRERKLNRETGEFEIVETKRVSKVIPRKWQPLAWWLERTSDDFKLKNPAKDELIDSQSNDDDLWIMDALTKGIAQKVKEKEGLKND